MMIPFTPGLSLPIEVVTRKLAWIGTTGSGKTYGAIRLAEFLWKAGAQFVALDPVGVWYGLRLATDGRSPGIPITVFGGLNGDIEISPADGATIADLIVNTGISCVIDVSQFETDADKCRFARDWCDRFFFRKKAAPSAVHIFLEEAQEFLPLHAAENETKMLHHFRRMWKVGRNFGIGGSLISQSPQSIDVRSRNLSDLLFAFRTGGTHERKALKDWVKGEDPTLNIDTLLPSLQNGEPYAWSAQWLGVSSQVGRISARETFDSSATPEVGQIAIARTLAPVALGELRDQLAKVREAEKEPVKKASGVTTQGFTQADLDARFQAGKDAALAELNTQGYAFLAEIGATIQTLEQSVARIRTQIWPFSFAMDGLASEGAVMAAIQVPAEAIGTPPSTYENRREAVEAVLPPAPTRKPRAIAPRSADAGQPILDTIAFFASIGVESPSLDHVGAYLSRSPNSGHFRGLLNDLRDEGLVTTGSGSISLTEAGRAKAKPAPRLTLAQLHGSWIAKAGGLAGEILRYVFAHPDRPVSLEELGAELGKSHNSGYFRGQVKELRKMGVVTFAAGCLSASRFLFPRGLK